LHWLRYLFQNLRISIPELFQVYCDNMAAMHIAANLVFLERTKHIKLDCIFVLEKLESSLINTTYIRSSDQVADIFTKSLGSNQFYQLVSKLGLSEIASPAPTCRGR